jgi:hypothetical protein
MAYGANHELGWIEAWSNGYYRVSNYVVYKQDLENRKLEITLTNQQCCSLDSFHTFYNYADVNNGYGWQVMGGQVVDVVDSVNVPAGGCWSHNGDRYASVEVKYNDDGSVPDILMSTQFIANKNQHDTPEFDWITKNIKSYFPTISAKPDPPKAPTNLKATNITINQATLTWNAISGASTYIVATGLNTDGAPFYESYSSTNEYLFTRLVENTEYKWKVKAVGAYGQQGEYSSVATFKTLSSQAKVKVNVGGTMKTGKVFVNVNGQMKKVKKIYVNVNGQAKECV